MDASRVIRTRGVDSLRRATRVAIDCRDNLATFLPPNFPSSTSFTCHWFPPAVFTSLTSFVYCHAFSLAHWNSNFYGLHDEISSLLEKQPRPLRNTCDRNTKLETSRNYRVFTIHVDISSDFFRILVPSWISFSGVWIPRTSRKDTRNICKLARSSRCDRRGIYL